MMPRMSNVSGLRLVVTHVVKRARKNVWVACTFITKAMDINPPTYYYGFETFRPINESVVEGEERRGSVLKLDKAEPVNQNQCLWLTKTGDVWLAVLDDPLGDSNKILVATNVG